jgi:multicomponent Na+:H+ antiporter subunit G
VTWAAVADMAGMLCLLAGAALSLTAAIGLLRFPDLLSRMHAATKPQVLGLVLTLLGVGLRVRVGLDVGMLVLVAVFQMLTAPVAAHLVGRAAYRTHQIDGASMAIDEQADLSDLSAGAVDPDELRPRPDGPSARP